MKKLNLLMLVVSISLLAVGHSQKPKKTFDADKFAAKVKFSFVPEYINSRSPDAAAIQYIADKTGKKRYEVEDQDKLDRQSLKDDVTTFSKFGLIFSLERVEVKVKQESPVKTADIIMHCSTGTETFTITLENCIQTDISWYLGDGCSWEGSLFADLEKNMVNTDSDNKEPDADEMSTQTEKPKVDLGLPPQYQGLTGSWKFKAVFEGEKDITENYEDGFLNERPITMSIGDDTYVMFQKGVRDRRKFDYCFWKYLKPEERDEKEPEIDLTFTYYYQDGKEGTEKFTLVAVSETELVYENKALNMRWVWTRL